MVKKEDEGTWEDCGCPLSVNFKRGEVIVRAPLPHACTVSKDEIYKHYICDRAIYDVLSEAPGDSMLGKWVAIHLQERRLFVVKPAPRPPLPPVPWRYDEPDVSQEPLKPGWRPWAPTSAALVISEDVTLEEYDRNITDLIELIGVEEVWERELMMDTAEGWLLACGESPLTGEDGNILLKVDRVYVTSIFAFHLLMMGKWLTVGWFVKEMKLGQTMGSMRRLLDIEMDARVHQGGCGHIFNSG